MRDEVCYLPHFPCIKWVHADIGLCSGSTDEKVKGWDTTRAVCITTAKLSGVVLAIAPSDCGMLLCALDKPEMQLVDVRSQNCGVVGTCSTGEHPARERLTNVMFLQRLTEEDLHVPHCFASVQEELTVWRCKAILS